MKYIILVLTLVCYNLYANKVEHWIEIPKNTSHFSLRIVNDNNNAHIISQINNNAVSVETPQAKPVKQASQIKPSLLQKYMQMMADHKGKMVLGGATLFCAVMLATVRCLQYAYMQSTGWVQWHEEYSFQELQTLSQKQLAHELFADIKRLYLPQEHRPLDFLDPLVQFSNACQQEKNHLQWLITLQEMLATMHLLWLLPQQDTLRKTYEDNLEKLTYLKQLIVTHLDEYSIP